MRIVNSPIHHTYTLSRRGANWEGMVRAVASEDNKRIGKDFALAVSQHTVIYCRNLCRYSRKVTKKQVLLIVGEL